MKVLRARRDETMERLSDYAGTVVTRGQIATTARGVCEWCGMSEFRAVCGDCCMLRLLSALPDPTR